MDTENGSFGTTMLVGPTGYGGGGYGMSGGGFGFGGDWAWILLLLVLFGGWGNGGYGGGIGGGFDMYPWFNQSNQISNGFQTAALGDQLTAIQSAINNNATASLERSFAAQTAATQSVFDLSSQLANCCCENRLGLANLNSTILAENCADRAALSDGVRDIITSQNAGVQKILDVMCQDKIDAKNEKIADLERQLTMAQLAASQGAQTAAILANNEAQTTALEQYLAPVPRPAYIVQQPGCSQNFGCGCGA